MQGLFQRFALHGFVAAALGCLGSVTGSSESWPPQESYLYPAKSVDPAALRSDDRVVVTQTGECWSFSPVKGAGPTALLFFPGGGVEPIAYAPLARSVAAAGFAVHLVKLPGKPAAPDKHRQTSIAMGKAVIKANPGVMRWVVGGHSMGASIAARFVHEEPQQLRGLILIGTTHPRDFDLSSFTGEVTKVVGTEDLVARRAQSEANKKLLPVGATWVLLEGANHAQFGFYGPQPGDGKATISQEKQQQATREALINALRRVSGRELRPVEAFHV